MHIPRATGLGCLHGLGKSGGSSHLEGAATTESVVALPKQTPAATAVAILIQ